MAGPRRRNSTLDPCPRRTFGAWLRSLRTQILLWTILPVIIFLLGLSFTDVYGHQRAMQVMIEERDRTLVRAVAEQIAEELDRRVYLLQSVGNSESFRQAKPTLQERRLAPLLDAFPAGVLAVDNQGQPRASRRAAAWQQAPFVASLARAVSSQERPTYLAIAQEGLAPEHVAIAVPLSDRSGALIGLFPLLGSPIAQAVAGLQVTPEAQALLLDAQGHLIYHVGLLPTSKSPQPATGHGDGMITTSLAIGTTGWQIVLSEPWHRLVPLVLRYAQATVLIAIVAISICLLAVYSGLRYVTRPLQELGRQARRVAWGDFDAILDPVGGVEEITNLQQTLRQMVSQVRGYQAAMHSYVGAITQAQEEERLRLARELHDDTVQSLIALGQRLERAQKDISKAPERCASHLDELRRSIRHLIQELRRLIGDLRPLYLDDLGLVPTLEALVKTTQLTQPTLTVSGQPRRLSPDLELAVYRIVQAALKNVEQHAQAQRAWVQLSFEDQAIRVMVKDDGRGFVVPSSPDDLAREGHFGLLGMRERAILFGGWLTFESQPGRGTCVQVHLPTRPRAPSEGRQQS